MLGLKQIVDKAIGMTKESGDFKVKTCLVFDHPAVPKDKCPWVKGRDVWWQEQVSKQKPECKVWQIKPSYIYEGVLRRCPLYVLRNTFGEGICVMCFWSYTPYFAALGLHPLLFELGSGVAHVFIQSWHANIVA